MTNSTANKGLAQISTFTGNNRIAGEGGEGARSTPATTQ